MMDVKDVDAGDVEHVQEDVIRVKDQYYVRSTSALADDRTRVLKHGETFAVFDRYGDVQPVGTGAQGVYHEGTRFLSHLELRVGGVRPLLLSSTVKEDNALLAVDLTNPDLRLADGTAVPRGTVHVFRSKFLWDGACHERYRVSNFGAERVRVPFHLRFKADFADVFEVRGVTRARRGRRLPDDVDAGEVRLGYEGLDGVTRWTRIVASPVPASLTGSEIVFHADVPAKGEVTFFVTVQCVPHGDATPPRAALPDYLPAAGAAERDAAASRRLDCRIRSSNAQFNDWMNRSIADLRMLSAITPAGPYPYAGVPWFSTPFGRDGLITALSMLWVNPDVARGVLAYLAATQATEANPAQDAEPGKIMHETRRGEMAALGEVPFGRYYGSVDATPLFVVLAGQYWARTGDLDFVRGIWGNVEAALAWVDKYGDVDGDGLVEYARRSADGLVHQGWKDSSDPVSHADGSLAEAPIALAEVQAYVFEAKRQAAELAAALGHVDHALTLRQEAEALRRRFEDAFWSPRLGMYAIALDGSKEPCLTRTSNAGHCLQAGIASPERAARTADALLAEDMWTGWGIRTLGAREVKYNPMSYHNGSVWPHDNALVAAGFARYGLKAHALRVLTGHFDASQFVDLHRLPELFCGFPRRPGEGPTLYPVACAPQAWAASAPFLLLQSALGLAIDAPNRRVTLHRPILPEFLNHVEVRGLRVGDATLDLHLDRYEDDVGINVRRRDGEVEVVAVK